MDEVVQCESPSINDRERKGSVHRMSPSMSLALSLSGGLPSPLHEVHPQTGYCWRQVTKGKLGQPWTCLSRVSSHAVAISIEQAMSLFVRGSQLLQLTAAVKRLSWAEPEVDTLSGKCLRRWVSSAQGEAHRLSHTNGRGETEREGRGTMSPTELRSGSRSPDESRHCVPIPRRKQVTP